MSKNIKLLYVILFIFFTHCSFGSGTGKIWTDLSEELEREKAREDSKIIFSTQKTFESEITSSKKIIIEKPVKNKEWSQQNLLPSNLVPHLIYNSEKNLILKSKKYGKNTFNLLASDFEPIIEMDTIFFYDPHGTIFCYSITKKKIFWKYNFYKKRYKNIPKELSIAISKKNIIISDNLGFLYSIKKGSGKINWAKNYGVPFRSNIKVDGDNVFLINQDNKFYVVSESNGQQKLDLETFPSFLKSNSKSNISLDNIKKNVYFTTSAAEIYSLNYKNRNINWLFNLTGAGTSDQVDLFSSSPVIFSDNEIILSTVLSTFSMNSTTGVLNWEFPFSSSLAPIVLNDYIFLASRNGFFLSLERKTGKIIWSRSIFKKLKKLTFEKTGNINSFLILSDKIFVSTEKGYFIFLNYQNGEIINYSKVSKGFFSKPIVYDGTILIIDNKMRILRFN